MPQTNDIADRVRKVIADHLGVDIAKVIDDANIRDDLGADSLDAVEIVIRCEEEFGIEIPDEDLDALTTVGDAIKIVRGMVA